MFFNLRDIDTQQLTLFMSSMEIFGMATQKNTNLHV